MENYDKIKALADYLETDESDITNSYDDIYEVASSGEEYLVCDEDEAYDYAVQDIKDIFDDLGLESFTPSFQEWIKDNAINTEWFDDSMRENFEYYVNDIEDEEDSVYENRLIAELVDNGILTEDDFDNWGEDEPTLKDTVDIDDKKEEYVNQLCDTSKDGDSVEYFRLNFGEREFNDAVINNNLIDLDKVAEEAIDLDGVAHFISRYDGEEIDLGNGLFAYRQN